MNNALRTRIRELRKQKCWTQATLAEFCKLSDREIRRIESGKAKPSAETILALAQAFDMDSSELVALADEQPKPQAKSRLIVPKDGLELLNALSNSHEFAFLPEPTDDDMVSALIKDVLSFIEYSEMWNEISPTEQYTLGEQLTTYLRGLNAHGWSAALELKTRSARFRGYEGKDVTIPNWTTSTLFFVNTNAPSEQAEKVTPPESSPQMKFGFMPEQ
jgi:transcriptional regulator with XRE-family HTH domain